MFAEISQCPPQIDAVNVHSTMLQPRMCLAARRPFSFSFRQQQSRHSKVCSPTTSDHEHHALACWTWRKFAFSILVPFAQQSDALACRPSFAGFHSSNLRLVEQMAASPRDILRLVSPVEDVNCKKRSRQRAAARNSVIKARLRDDRLTHRKPK